MSVTGYFMVVSILTQVLTEILSNTKQMKELTVMAAMMGA